MSTNTLLALLLEQGSDRIIITDEGGGHRLLEASAAFADYVGLKHDALIGRSCFDFLLLDEIDAVERQMAQQGQWQGELLLRDAHRETLLHTAGLQADEQGRWTWLMQPQSTPAEVAERRLQYDALTGLPNRSLFADRAEQALITSQRHNQSVAILCVGLDGFSRINDGLGHEFGDQMLKEMALRVSKTLRTSDTVARMGGDQFDCVVAMNAGDDGAIVAEKLLQALKQPFSYIGQDISVTASIGVSVFPSDGKEAGILVKQAESAMRHCKRTGGDSYQFFSYEMNDRAKRRIDLENALRRALDQDEFVLYYQPKVDVASGMVVGAEALIRWQHPQHGMIPPGEFIPVAEESGLISPIGSWVAREACRQNREWLSRGINSVCISINMAAPQFRSREVVSHIAQILRESGLPAEYLELEITEGLLIGDLDAIEEKLQGFRDLGLKIAIDDFGTGYSSLSYLSRFPITTLKIDRAFVHDVERNRSTAEIARAIIGLSRGLELEVVAEGAETFEHIEFLTEQGCDTVQGYFYSRPLPANEFEEMLRRGTVN